MSVNSEVCSETVANMPVGFHGKVCIVIDNEKHTWFIQSLVKATKALPVTSLELKELDTYLDENAWFQGKNEPTIRAFIEHYQRVERADLTYPIIYSPQFGVLDGLHRIVKAHLKGFSSIKAVVLNELPNPDFTENI